ncbi:MAG: acylphosphatase [Phycisphaera sp.]|nr:MAG: acylphosphatase [Phycisphaera sp.]
MAIRTAVRYLGRVQGVGFRATARSLAQLMPITGLVRNEPDGTVWLEAQGQPGDVEAFLGELTRAMHGCIDRANREELPVQEHEAAFQIAR